MSKPRPAFEYNEKSYSSWAPYMAPIKVTMTVGIVLMLLQAVAIFFKDLAKVRGVSIDHNGENEELAI